MRKRYQHHKDYYVTGMPFETTLRQFKDYSDELAGLPKEDKLLFDGEEPKAPDAVNGFHGSLSDKKHILPYAGVVSILLACIGQIVDILFNMKSVTGAIAFGRNPNHFLTGPIANLLSAIPAEIEFFLNRFIVSVVMVVFILLEMPVSIFIDQKKMLNDIGTAFSELFEGPKKPDTKPFARLCDNYKTGFRLWKIPLYAFYAFNDYIAVYVMALMYKTCELICDAIILLGRWISGYEASDEQLALDEMTRLGYDEIACFKEASLERFETHKTKFTQYLKQFNKFDRIDTSLYRRVDGATPGERDRLTDYRIRFLAILFSSPDSMLDSIINTFDALDNHELLKWNTLETFFRAPGMGALNEATLCGDTIQRTDLESYVNNFLQTIQVLISHDVDLNQAILDEVSYNAKRSNPDHLDEILTRLRTSGFLKQAHIPFIIHFSHESTALLEILDMIENLGFYNQQVVDELLRGWTSPARIKIATNNYDTVHQDIFSTLLITLKDLVDNGVFNDLINSDVKNLLVKKLIQHKHLVQIFSGLISEYRRVLGASFDEDEHSMRNDLSAYIADTSSVSALIPMLDGYCKPESICVPANYPSVFSGLTIYTLINIQHVETISLAWKRSWSSNQGVPDIFFKVLLTPAYASLSSQFIYHARQQNFARKTNFEAVEDLPITNPKLAIAILLAAVHQKDLLMTIEHNYLKIGNSILTRYADLLQGATHSQLRHIFNRYKSIMRQLSTVTEALDDTYNKYIQYDIGGARSRNLSALRERFFILHSQVGNNSSSNYLGIKLGPSKDFDDLGGNFHRIVRLCPSMYAILCPTIAEYGIEHANPEFVRALLFGQYLGLPSSRAEAASEAILYALNNTSLGLEDTGTTEVHNNITYRVLESTALDNACVEQFLELIHQLLNKKPSAHPLTHCKNLFSSRLSESYSDNQNRFFFRKTQVNLPIDRRNVKDVYNDSLTDDKETVQYHDYIGSYTQMRRLTTVITQAKRQANVDILCRHYEAVDSLRSGDQEPTTHNNQHQTQSVDTSLRPTFCDLPDLCMEKIVSYVGADEVHIEEDRNRIYQEHKNRLEDIHEQYQIKP